MKSLWRATVMVTTALAVLGATTPPVRTLEDYRYFRALSIDLVGRTPTVEEVTAFEQRDFDVDGWIDRHLQGPAYAERLRRVYMDAMRLDIGSTFQFVPPSITLRRQQLLGPDGRQMYVYFRQGQRRVRPETDGEFCLTEAETGLRFPRSAAATGTPARVAQRVLDQYTTVVRPWWLYRDYRGPNPVDRYSDLWSTQVPGFVPAPALLVEPDGSPTMTVRVCREEALTPDTGTVFATGRTGPRPPRVAPPRVGPAAANATSSSPPPSDATMGRTTPLPQDTPFAQAHHGEPIGCASGTAFQNSADCGCGVGLERCMPGDAPSFEPRAFVFPRAAPLGIDDPFDQVPQPAASWERFWWTQEAIHFLDQIFGEDRDFREVLTSHATNVNGPLAQFYSFIAPATCCGQAAQLGYAQPDPIFDPRALPSGLLPHDVTTWVPVADRGVHSSGILTMPVFLTKYGSRRARAHVLYSTFLCRDFVAENVPLAPSTEPNLMVRQGCSACHATLEPLAAYFTRISESDWTYLPDAQFPLDNATCAQADARRIPGRCRNFYDPAFTDAHHALLRGAYGSTAHAERGAAGIADELIHSDQFAPCVASQIASSFLGRPLTTDDAGLQHRLADVLIANGFHPRALVRELLHSDQYRRANNLNSPEWRREHAQ